MQARLEFRALLDRKALQVSKDQPEQMVSSITSASVNGAGHLILTLTNGQTIDAGSVIGPQGQAGPQGPTGPAGGGSGTQNVVVNMPSFADLVSATQPSVVEIDVSATLQLAVALSSSRVRARGG